MRAANTIVSGRFDSDSDGARLDRALAAQEHGLSRARIQGLIAADMVSVDGKIVRQAKLIVRADMAYRICLPPPVEAMARPENIPLTIAFEDAHLIVIDKPAGLVVHPAAGHATGTLVNALLHHCRGQLSGIGGITRPGIVHRIDKDTSGLLVAAKSDAAHQGLSALFKAHDIERRYLAIVHGVPKSTSGTISGHIGRSSRDRKKMAVVEPPVGKHATTHYRLLDPLAQSSLVECRLETGRTHQVRVHMAHIGHPLVGDPLYATGRKSLLVGGKRIPFCRQALHATSLGFVHPITKEKLQFSSDLPQDMQFLFSQLKR
jgi:23S rRNA pseudouridine1911/1915/1917 synthase